MRGFWIGVAAASAGILAARWPLSAPGRGFYVGLIALCTLVALSPHDRSEKS